MRANKAAKVSATMRANTQRARSARLLAAAACAGLLAGCGSMPAGVPGVAAAGQDSAVPSASGPLAPPVARVWPDQAQDVLNQRVRNYGLVHAPDMQRYLNGLYARIKTQAGVPGWPGQVYILADESLNAYVTAAGNIYLSLSWLTSVESEDELVALLSHEFGHVYLHYHQLEGAIASADMAAGTIGVGIALVKKTGQVAGWSHLDSLIAAYAAGKGLMSTLYSRSQESAADMFALNLSWKLGYSYEHGMKAFLERIAGWEDRNQEQKKRAQDQQLAAIRKSAIDNANKPAPGKGPNLVHQALAQPTGAISAAANSTLQQWSFDLERKIAQMRSDHPEIAVRLEALALAADSVPAAQADAMPVVAPLSAARKEKRTAAIFSNYELAFRAIGAPGDPAAVALARGALTGPTATHAVPLLALYTVRMTQPAANGRNRNDAAELLDINMQSEPDRAWRVYLIQAARLKAANQRTPAKAVLDAGLAYFGTSEEVWPDAIRFIGQLQGWDEAKRTAAACGKHFQRMRSRCGEAATSPSEIAAAERKAEAKAKNLVDRMFKKK